MKRKFIINKAFSINNDKDFRDYAHNLMKNAHGDEYSEETTNKVVDDLIKDNPNADYGELIGRLTSGFSKNYSNNQDPGYFEKKNKELLAELRDLQTKSSNLDSEYQNSLDKLKQDYQKKKEKLDKKYDDWKSRNDEFNKKLRDYLNK